MTRNENKMQALYADNKVITKRDSNFRGSICIFL